MNGVVIWLSYMARCCRRSPHATDVCMCMHVRHAGGTEGASRGGIDLCAALSGGSGGGSDGSDGPLGMQLGVVAEWLAEVLALMHGVLEPALLDGAFFSAVSTINNRLVQAFTASETKQLSVAAVRSLAAGLDIIRGFALSAPVESLALLLDQAQQLVALVIQADAWVEAVCSAGGRKSSAGAPEVPWPDEEGGFLHPEVRGMILPRLSLQTIASVLERLESRGPPGGEGGAYGGQQQRQQESRASKVRRQAADNIVRRRAKELARAEAAEEQSQQQLLLSAGK